MNDMSRIVPAAVQLIEQVTTEGKKVGAKIADEPDGFGRHRAIEFDAATSRWLGPVLDVIAPSEGRILRVDYAGKGNLVVTFVADTRADHRDEYPISEVRKILEETTD